MKLYELKAIAKRLNDFTFISRARRIEDNTLEIMFDKSQSYFFNMTRGNSTVYKAPSQDPYKGTMHPLILYCIRYFLALNLSALMYQMTTVFCVSPSLRKVATKTKQSTFS